MPKHFQTNLFLKQLWTDCRWLRFNYSYSKYSIRGVLQWWIPKLPCVSTLKWSSFGWFGSTLMALETSSELIYRLYRCPSGEIRGHRDTPSLQQNIRVSGLRPSYQTLPNETMLEAWGFGTIEWGCLIWTFGIEWCTFGIHSWFKMMIYHQCKLRNSMWTKPRYEIWDAGNRPSFWVWFSTLGMIITVHVWWSPPQFFYGESCEFCPLCDFVIPRCEKITLPRCGSHGFGLSNMPRCVAPQRTRCLHLSEISQAGHVHTISGNWKFQHGHVRTDISTTFSRLVNPKSTGKRRAVLRRTSGSCDLGQAKCLAELQVCHDVSCVGGWLTLRWWRQRLNHEASVFQHLYLL